MFFRKQKPAGNDNLAAITQPTVIAAGMHVDGNVSGDGELQVEGSITGTVEARICAVAASGHVTGELRCDEVMVHGRVKGPINARHVHLMPDATVEGDITCETIAIETGARLSGAVWQQNQAPALEHRAAEPSHTPALFSDSLWPPRQDDDFRPLKAIKPRASNFR